MKKTAATLFSSIGQLALMILGWTVYTISCGIILVTVYQTFGVIVEIGVALLMFFATMAWSERQL